MAILSRHNWHVTLFMLEEMPCRLLRDFRSSSAGFPVAVGLPGGGAGVDSFVEQQQQQQQDADENRCLHCTFPHHIS
ncbi:hypothetical protein BV898_05679 [Hypsibius exemplaris]|uniref:Uncharacterized protein n=1 Tax=Hypsibius exemplaris TaxID=2072580 RepID=A0A1W0WYX4_HYPEX|nr:hypothetical protein BV898_05679 [Hypsibius exemplaris]